MLLSESAHTGLRITESAFWTGSVEEVQIQSPEITTGFQLDWEPWASQESVPISEDVLSAELPNLMFDACNVAFGSGARVLNFDQFDAESSINTGPQATDPTSDLFTNLCGSGQVEITSDPGRHRGRLIASASTVCLASSPKSSNGSSNRKTRYVPDAAAHE